MKLAVAFLCFTVLFCIYQITKQLFILIPATYRTWNIVKYLKKSAMISYVVREADKRGLFDRYKEVRLKHGKANYIARKDSEGIIWLGNYKISQVVYDPPKIEKTVEKVRDMISDKDYVLFEKFFLKELGNIHRAVTAMS